MTALRFTGLDLALRGSGVARADDTFVTIKPAPRLEGYWRHDDVADRIIEVVAEDAPALVVLEDYAPHSFGINATIASAEIGGLVRLELTRAGIAFFAIKPNTMKLYATGRGNASKGLVFDTALEHFPKTVTAERRPANYDEADAYWLRRMARHHYLGETDGKDRAGVLAGIDWPELER